MRVPRPELIDPADIDATTGIRVLASIIEQRGKAACYAISDGHRQDALQHAGVAKFACRLLEAHLIGAPETPEAVMSSKGSSGKGN